MTRKEAINILELENPFLGGDDYKLLSEAIDLAIEALKAQIDKDTNVPSNGDTIYRQDAILAVKTRDWLTEGAKEALTDRLEKLPSAQPERCEYYALCRHGRDENKLRARLKFCEYCNEDVDGFVTPIEKNNHAFVRFGMNGWELSLKANGWHGSAKIRYCPMCGRDLFVK